MSDIDTGRLRERANHLEGMGLLDSADDMENAADRIDALEAENARLRAIEDQLPKTADGVAVTHGSSVWQTYGPDDLTETILVLVAPHRYEEGVRIDSPFCKFYSTREAAEAAREASGDE